MEYDPLIEVVYKPQLKVVVKKSRRKSKNEDAKEVTKVSLQIVWDGS